MFRRLGKVGKNWERLGNKWEKFGKVSSRCMLKENVNP